MQMRLALIFIIVLQSSISAFAAQEVATMLNLKKFQWKNRFVLVYVPDSGAELWEKQKVWFDVEAKENAERSLKLIRLRAEDKAALAYLGLEQVGPSFVALLVGKDGGIKARFSKPSPMEEFYRLIDAMPMRVEEMKDRN